MKSRKTTETENKRVIRYCEFVVLFIVSIFVNFKLAVCLLIASPIIIPIIVGIKDRNYHFFHEQSKETKEIVKTEFCA